MIGDAAIARIPSEIVARQSLRVNNVAGATLSSMAIQAAATNAVKAAGGTRTNSTRRRLRSRLPTLILATRQPLSLSVPAPAEWLQRFGLS